MHNLKSFTVTLDPNDNSNFLVNKEDIIELLTLIHETYKMEEYYEWDLSMHFSILNYLSEEQDSKF
ncbi:hypothetical protein ABFY48_18400 [Lysinibacillus pakistanensis]|uniref:hypothetical protein n=1 Tax=Lysinibacillus pakistanensis TaxID=759811 RepID=UPI003D2D4E2D